MAKSPSKRRGITLGARAGDAAELERLNVQPPGPARAISSGDSGIAPEMLEEQLAQLRHLNADLGVHWQRQSEQMKEQFQLLEQQREEIEHQTLQLEALKQTQRRSRRLGVLLSLLVATGVTALGYHAWPRFQHVAGDLNRLSTGVAQLAPQLQTVHGQVTSLTSDVAQIDSTMTSLRKDVSGVHSDLGSIRQVVDTRPKNAPAVQANVVSKHRAAYTLPRNATTMNYGYRAMRPMRPW